MDSVTVLIMLFSAADVNRVTSYVKRVSNHVLVYHTLKRVRITTQPGSPVDVMACKRVDFTFIVEAGV